MTTNRTIITFLSAIFLSGMLFTAGAQTLFDEMIVDGETVSSDSVAIPASGQTDASGSISWRKAPARPQRRNPRAKKEKETVPSLWTMTDSAGNLLLDSLDFGPQVLEVDPDMDVTGLVLPRITYTPPIFSTYSVDIPGVQPDPIDVEAKNLADYSWTERAAYQTDRYRNFLQRFMIDNPQLVRYNLATMPRPPKEFVMEVDPSQAKISVKEFTRDRSEMVKVAKPVELKRINWLSTFDGSLQFSQAYISPNWYQGGQSNLNAILNLFYDIKLNPAFHPNLIFETSFQYKLGLNNAPDDTVHAYNITEDLFQVNTKFGLRAAKHWYYSVTGQFKTQLLNSYPSNSEKLKSAFMSPGELNVGVGMTYSIENPKKTLNFTAAISPLSYNLKTCINRDLNPTSFGIEEGKHHINQYGSSAELTFRAKLAYNIEYFSRLFTFTDYTVLQADWENTITFNINRFLSTKIFAHLRYQSDMEPQPDTRWEKWQLKEILSIGFSYRFSRS